MAFLLLDVNPWGTPGLSNPMASPMSPTQQFGLLVLLTLIPLGMRAASVVMISPRNSHDPSSRLIRQVFFPIQPSPARTAQALSIIGWMSST